MKKSTLTILISIVIAIIGGAFYVANKDYTFRFSESQIQEKLSARLPVSKTFFFIFQVTLDHPSVTFVSESKRVRAGLDVVLNIVLGNETKPLKGKLNVSGCIFYAPARGAFFLTDPIIEQFIIEGMPEKYKEKIMPALTNAIAAYFADHPIYTLRSTDTLQAAAKLVLKSVTVENGELVIKLGL